MVRIDTHIQAGWGAERERGTAKVEANAEAEEGGLDLEVEAAR